MLGGKMVIERVYEQVAKAVERVVVATDDERIFDAVRAFGGEVVMTSTEHRSGTDRCAEAVEELSYDADIVINVQGDEPFIAPEHLELQVDDPFAYLDAIRNAGSVFLGRSCPEALGDYFAGPNHTLPTSGTARFSSPLSVDDFVKKSQFLYYTPEALDAVAEDVALFARKEGLEAHARSALVRKNV
jgi:histidinol dehydrogenase